MKTVAFNPRTRSNGYKKPLSLFTRRDGHTRPVVVQVVETNKKVADKNLLQLSPAQYTRRDGYAYPISIAAESKAQANVASNDIWYF